MNMKSKLLFTVITIEVRYNNHVINNAYICTHTGAMILVLVSLDPSNCPLRPPQTPTAHSA